MTPLDLYLDLLGQFDCSICLSTAQPPVTTPCGHTFCQGCLETMVQTVRSECPNCRHYLVEGVPHPNIAVQAVIEKCRALRERLLPREERTVQVVEKEVFEKVRESASRASCYYIDLDLIPMAQECYSAGLAKDLVSKLRGHGFTVLNLELFEFERERNHLIRIAWRQVIETNSLAWRMLQLTQEASERGS